MERIANNGHNYKRKFQVEADAAKETVLADLRRREARGTNPCHVCTSGWL
ncbi:hypothetical protein IH992_04445 [Candidatus Poribacteria bacterium]|nr:hypothetical protein [Candidatus Poribacteria bacterium]